MKFVVYDHAGKSLYLRQRLLEIGHEVAQNADEVELLLLDCDWPWAHPRPGMIDSAIGRGAKVALYPHGGRPTVFVYDGICQPDDRVSLRLEHGQGSLDIAYAFTDQDLHQEATGWLYCPTKPFEPVEHPTKVVFFPLHANIEMLQRGSNGHDPAPGWNQQIYRRVLSVPDIELVVSLVGPAYRTGVWPHPRARFTPNPHMLFHHTFEQILHADVVIAAGTPAAAAVALGKPVVMFGQSSFVDYVDGEYVQAAHQDAYRDLVRYPFDTDEGPLIDLIRSACDGNEAATEWRARFVGDDGSENAIRLLEELVAEQPGDVPQSVSVIIEGATAAAALKGG